MKTKIFITRPLLTVVNMPTGLKKELQIEKPSFQKLFSKWDSLKNMYAFSYDNSFSEKLCDKFSDELGDGAVERLPK